MKKKSFTLLEIIFALVIFSLIFWMLFTLFLRMLRSKTDIDARQMVITATYELVEDINSRIQNYTIDYEEYFNRRMVGCAPWTAMNNFAWNTWIQNWYCPLWTTYGNSTPLVATQTYVSNEREHKIYYCSSEATLPLFGATSVRMQYSWWALTVQWAWSCAVNLFSIYSNASYNANYVANWSRFFQPYWQYNAMHIDARANADDEPWYAWDDDDTYLWVWPVAIWDSANAKELYMISKDKKTRLFFRRALIATGDWNENGSIDNDSERKFTVQVLQLKWFDAWQEHDFDAAGAEWVYDGTIDTWACDYEAGFRCNGSGMWSVYTGYRLPLDWNDGWVNMVNANVSISDWNLAIFPEKDPELVTAENRYQHNPYFRLYIKTSMFGKDRINRVGANIIDDITFDVQTTLNIKTNY
jgi:type II secretory pathway pseudopilin PulG